MSISLFVYSPNPPLERDLLARTLVDAGLPEDARWEIAFSDDIDVVRPVEGGTMTSQTIYGWRQDENAPAVRAAIDARDRAAVDALYSDDSVAAVWVSVRTRGDAEWNNEELDEAASAASEAHRKEIASAITIYEVETSARRNDASLEFQRFIWSGVGILSNGLMEDPQEGEYVSAKELAADDQPAQPARVRARGTSGTTAVNAAIVLMAVLDVLWPKTLMRHLFTLGVLAPCWYFVRKRDPYGWWLLLIFAVGSLGLNLWFLPGASGERAVYRIVRAVGYAAAAILLMLPSSRRAAGVK